MEALKKLQHANGSFPWFAGGPEDRFLTQWIVIGLGQLQKLQAMPGASATAMAEISKPALAWLDQTWAADFALYKKNPAASKARLASPLLIQYLYLRSFFPGPAQSLPPAYQFFLQQAQRQSLASSPALQAMLALALHRKGHLQPAAALVKVVTKNSHAKPRPAAFDTNWWLAPAESKALLLEAFNEITGNTPAKDSLLQSLLAQKENTVWGTRSATAAACYALLLAGDAKAGSPATAAS